MESELRDKLFLLLGLYRQEKGALAVNTLERRAIGYCGFFKKLGADRSFNIRKYDDLVLWFSENWPIGVEWPEEVERPIIGEPAE